MSQVVRTMISCPRCGQSFGAIIEQIIDVGHDPQAKARFLSGRINMVSCPNCGNMVAVGTPLLYHDPDKKLMLIYVPMELNIDQQERERVIGDLARRLTDSIPPEKRLGYLLQPRQVLTIPGMIDIILDADGITEEVREAQREKVRVMEMFLQVNPDQWPALIEEQEAQIDLEFFRILGVMIENSAQTGKAHMAEGLLGLYNYLIQNTAIGQEAIQTAQTQEAIVHEVAAELQAMGEQMTREDFMHLVLSYAGDDERIQALVGLIRPALDYTFFQDLAERIDQAKGKEQEKLLQLRDQLLELTSMVDQQTQVVLQRATDTLRAIASSEDIDAAIRPRLEQIDDTFLVVVQANIRAAEQRNDPESAERFKQILRRSLEILRESAPPQVRFINDLLSVESEDQARALIEEQAPRFGPELLDMMEAIALDLEEGDQADNAQYLRALMDYAENYVTFPS